MNDETIIWPTPEEIAAYEAMDEDERTFHREPAPKILVPLDLDDLDLIQNGLQETGVLGLKQDIDAYWVALKVRTEAAGEHAIPSMPSG